MYWERRTRRVFPPANRLSAKPRWPKRCDSHYLHFRLCGTLLLRAAPRAWLRRDGTGGPWCSRRRWLQKESASATTRRTAANQPQGSWRAGPPVPASRRLRFSSYLRRFSRPSCSRESSSGATISVETGGASPEASQVVGNGLIFVEANATGIGADEALVEDAPRQLVELILFQRLQHARPDFGGAGNLLQRDFALFALQLQFFAKGRQPSLPLSPDGERNSTLSGSKIIDYSVGTEPRASSRELRAKRAARGSWPAARGLLSRWPPLKPGWLDGYRLPTFVARAAHPNL